MCKTCRESDFEESYILSLNVCIRIKAKGSCQSVTSVGTLQQIIILIRKGYWILQLIALVFLCYITLGVTVLVVFCSFKFNLRINFQYGRNI